MGHFLLFDPQGAIGIEERHVIIVAVLLMFVVAIPTFIILFAFARKYRAGNVTATYSPNLNHNKGIAILLWTIPAALIAVLAVMNWNTTHDLDPSKSIASANAPLTIQVIALPWKFLFIYPAQNIATVNFVQFPVDTPVNFQLTADAPMSSFWIPQLGSQIAAMPAMTTRLNLIANTTGDFPGMDTEINGAGFSGMKFTARSTSQADFDAWVASVQQASTTLDLLSYTALAEPSENNPVAIYAVIDPNLYNEVIAKYTMPN